LTEPQPIPTDKNLMHRFRMKRRALLVWLMLLMGIGLWWQRGIVLQWGLNHLLQQTPLTQTRFSGLQMDLQQTQLAQMQFNLQTASGLLVAQLQGISLAYELQPVNLQSLHIDQAKLRFNYQPEDRPKNDESTAATPALPLSQAEIDQLTLEIDTPWGVSQISGRFQLDALPSKPVLITVTDSAQTITLEIKADFSHAALAVVQASGAQIMELRLDRPTLNDWQINLQADASALWQWLTTSELLPNQLRSEIKSAAFMQANPNIADMQFELTATSADNLDKLQGRLLLTRAKAYLASADMTLKPAKSQWQVDAHLDLAAAELMALLKPWLPGAMNGWQYPAGNVMGTVRLKGQPKLPIVGEVYLKAHHLDVLTGPVKATDGYLRLDVSNFVPLIMAMEADFPTLQLGEKTVIKQLQVNAGFNNRILILERATMPAFGGLVEVLPDKIDISQLPIMLTLGVHDMDLQQLLASLNYPPLSGTGRLNGKLPLSLSADSIEVRDGELTATQPGVLRYQAPGATEDNLALKTLSNMRYHSLQAKLNYQPSGDYRVGVRLEGKNPQVLSGHLVAFNLNLTGSLPELIKKGIMAGDFDKPILEQIKNAQH
jgi:hypothetical protein